MQHKFFMYNRSRISFYFISTEINIQALMLCTGDWGWVCFFQPHHLEWIIKHVWTRKRWKDLSTSWNSSTQGCVKWTLPGCWLTLSRMLEKNRSGRMAIFETLRVYIKFNGFESVRGEIDIATQQIHLWERYRDRLDVITRSLPTRSESWLHHSFDFPSFVAFFSLDSTKLRKLSHSIFNLIVNRMALHYRASDAVSSLDFPRIGNFVDSVIASVLPSI